MALALLLHVNVKYPRKLLLLSDRMAGLMEGLPIKLEAIL